ncbi:MAG: DUF6119 family protein, partial [Burkholderiales bacterium]
SARSLWRGRDRLSVKFGNGRPPSTIVTMRERAAELRQLNAYLLKSSVTSAAEAIKDEGDIEQYDLRATVDLEGAVFIRRPDGRAPRWAHLISSLIEGDPGDLRNRHVSAVLIARRQGRWIALTFGFGRFLLRPDVIELDFGLKVAASLVDPDSVISVDARSVEERVLQTRRQSSDPSRAEAIGLDTEREMLRAMTGTLRDRELGRRVSGSVAAGLTSRTALTDLGARLDVLLAAYRSGDYRRRFGHIDRLQPVDDPQLLAELDEELLRHLRDGSVRLAVPEIVDWDDTSGFTYTGVRDELFAIPDLADYLRTRAEEPTVASVRRQELKLVAADEERVVATWSIYRSLLWETRRGDVVYAVMDGEWFAIAADYVARIDERLRNVSAPVFDVGAFDPLEHEVDYNQRLADAEPGRAMLDWQLARFESESGTIEMCDVFTDDRQLIHTKRSTAAKALSHLFAQGLTSADLLRNLPEFREQLRAALADQPELMALVPPERPTAGSFEVVFLIITPRPEDVPTALPFFSRSHLYRVLGELERLEVRVSVAGVPIRAGARPAAAGMPTHRPRRLAAGTTQRAAYER